MINSLSLGDQSAPVVAAEASSTTTESVADTVSRVVEGLRQSLGEGCSSTSSDSLSIVSANVTGTCIIKRYQFECVMAFHPACIYIYKSLLMYIHGCGAQYLNFPSWVVTSLGKSCVIPDICKLNLWWELFWQTLEQSWTGNNSAVTYHLVRNTNVLCAETCISSVTEKKLRLVVRFCLCDTTKTGTGYLQYIEILTWQQTNRHFFVVVSQAL